MKKGITLQDVIAAFNRRFDSMDRKMNRIDSTMHDIQKDVDGIQEEMRGIHKVLDRFDWRITRLEKHLGLEIKGSAG